MDTRWPIKSMFRIVLSIPNDFSWFFNFLRNINTFINKVIEWLSAKTATKKSNIYLKIWRQLEPTLVQREGRLCVAQRKMLRRILDTMHMLGLQDVRGSGNRNGPQVMSLFINAVHDVALYERKSSCRSTACSRGRTARATDSKVRTKAGWHHKAAFNCQMQAQNEAKMEPNTFPKT